MTDPLQRLLDMDEEGIDVAIIFGTSIGLMVNGMADKSLAATVCHAVNRWLVEEYLAPDPKRLKGVGLILVQDPAAAVKELKYLAQHRSIVTAMLPTNVYGINLGHRMFDPVYAAAQESACRCRSTHKRFNRIALELISASKHEIAPLLLVNI